MTGRLTLDTIRVRGGRLADYIRRHGVLCAAVNIVARFTTMPGPQPKWPVWRVAGRILTRHEIKRWHRQTSPRDVLNLGGGSNRMPGTMTLDRDPMADAWLDVTQPLPFDDQSADRIFLEEVIEHISLDAGRQLLAECYRVLEPGGVLRITTPDPEYFVQQGDCDGLNRIFYDHGHQYVYTRERLRAEAMAAGFEYRLSSYRDPSSRLGHLDTHPARFNHSPDISQYVELTRPAQAVTRTLRPPHR